MEVGDAEPKRCRGSCPTLIARTEVTFVHAAENESTIVHCIERYDMDCTVSVEEKRRACKPDFLLFRFYAICLSQNLPMGIAGNLGHKCYVQNTTPLDLHCHNRSSIKLHPYPSRHPLVACSPSAILEDRPPLARSGSVPLEIA